MIKVKNGTSDLRRAFSEDGAHKTHVGGQALIEGVMMRGRLNWAVAVRQPNGSIYTEEHDLASGRASRRWMHWPIVRGCTAFVESLVLGMKALEIAAAHAFAGDNDPTDQAGGNESSVTAVTADEATLSNTSAPSSFAGDISARHDAVESTEDGLPHVSTGSEPSHTSAGDEMPHTAFAASMVVGLVGGIVLFIVLPAFLTNLLVGEYDQATIAWNLVDGILRVAVLVFYIWLIGRMKDVKRMFGYHGAEHKAIHCFEHGLSMTPENARSFPRLHVRCGTAFLIMVMIIAIFVYTITPLGALITAWGVADGLPKLTLVIVSRIVLMPIIAGLSYEITVKWAGTHPENPLVKVILWPGMQMQYLTTREPDDGQIECAIRAMEAVLAREKQSAAQGE